MTSIFAAPPLASASLPETTVLRNGLTLVVRRDRAAPAVAIVTYVKAGYFDETDDVVGIAHVLEHMYFKGTPTRGVGEIARETKASGGYLNAHTIYDHTSYYTVVPSARFVDALAIQSDAYANSVIDAGELAREIEVIIQEVRRKEDSPSAAATEGLYALLYDRHRIRRWRIGRPDVLRTFTRDPVMGFYRNFYRPSNTILSIVGDVDPDAVRAAVEGHYGSLTDGTVHRTPSPSEPGNPSGMRYKEWGGDIVQTQLALGWRTVPALHPDTPMLDIAAMVLGTGRGSRLYRAVRERGFASSTTAYNYTPSEIGVFVVHIECPPDQTAAAARATWDQVERLGDEGVGAHELQRVQQLVESRLARRAESMEGQAMYAAEWQSLGDVSLGDRYVERVMAATPGEVTDAVRRYLRVSDLGVVLYRPTSTTTVAGTAAELVRPAALATLPPLEPLVPIPARATRTDKGQRPTLEHDEAGVRVYRTVHGVPILVRRKLGAPLTHVGIYALGGVRDEHAPRAGLTTLMVRAALKGAAGRSAAQLADAMEMLGGSVGASVGSDSFGWGLSVPLRQTPGALQLLADIVQEPTFSDETFDTERDLALVELTNLRDDMYRFPVRLATEAAYGQHPYGQNALGSDVSLPAITVDDVRAWHASRVLEAPAVVGVVTDADSDAVAAELARVLAPLQFRAPSRLDPPAWPAAPVTRVEQRDKSQTALAVAFPGPSRLDEDRTTAELIAGIASGLGGRFFEELRDRRSLAYTVHAFATERALAGMFIGYIATDPEKEEIAREGLLCEFSRLVAEGVTPDELRRAQMYALGTHAIGRQSGGTLLGEMLDAWLLGHGLGEVETYDARVQAVTPADVQRVAQQYFDQTRVVEGVVRGKGR